MKVIQLIQKPQLRGAEMFASQLSECLQSEGHEVTMLTLFPGNAKLPFNGRFVNLNRPAKSRFFDYSGYKQIAQLIKTEKPDIIQANAGDTLKYAVFSKLLFGWKTPIVFRNANKMGDFINSFAKKIFNKFLVKNVSYVVSVSQNCETDFKQTFTYSPEKITTVPIGINKFNLSGKIPEDLKHIFVNTNILVNVGSLVPEKNHRGLLQIFKQTKKIFPQTKLIIIGDGFLRKELEKYAADNSIDSDIYFLGYRTDVVDIIASADAFVMPSHIEGLPGVILEAFYCRTPVIANNVGGIGEVVIPNKTGWLIDKDRPDEFIKAITECFTNKQKSEIYAENAYKLVTHEYMNSQLTHKFISAYKKLLSR